MTKTKRKMWYQLRIEELEARVASRSPFTPTGLCDFPETAVRLLLNGRCFRQGLAPIRPGDVFRSNVDENGDMWTLGELDSPGPGLRLSVERAEHRQRMAQNERARLEHEAAGLIQAIRSYNTNTPEGERDEERIGPAKERLKFLGEQINANKAVLAERTYQEWLFFDADPMKVWLEAVPQEVKQETIQEAEPCPEPLMATV